MGESAAARQLEEWTARFYDGVRQFDDPDCGGFYAFLEQDKALRETFELLLGAAHIPDRFLPPMPKKGEVEAGRKNSIPTQERQGEAKPEQAGVPADMLEEVYQMYPLLKKQRQLQELLVYCL